jgi:hypothetical protein
MPLKLRPSGLSSGIDKDRQDFTIYSGGWAMGRIYQQRGGPESTHWFLSLHGIFGKPVDMRTAGQAKVQFETAGVGGAAGTAVVRGIPLLLVELCFREPPCRIDAPTPHPAAPRHRLAVYRQFISGSSTSDNFLINLHYSSLTD